MNVIITHKNCDFDALASAVAAAKLYPDSAVIIPEPLQANVRSFINLYRDLLPLSDPGDLSDNINSVIVVDTNKQERLGKWDSILEQAEEIIVYDHHPGELDFNADYQNLDQVGATTTILLEEIRKRKIELTEFEATLLILGIYEDTGCLTYEITTTRDARAAAYLWEYSPNTRLIQEYLRSPLTDIQKELFEKLIRSSEFYELNQRRVLISMTILDEYVMGAAVLLQLLDEIEDAGLTILIIQMKDVIYLAARSRDEDLNLLELLAPFNVKGYHSVVSASFKGVEGDEVKKQVIEFLKYYLPPALAAENAASRPVLTIRSDTTIAEADELLAEHSFTGCPVLEDGRLVGIVSRRDLRKGLRSRLGHAPVKGFMTRELITASPEQSLTDLRNLMVEENIGRVPIIEENGSLVGIVTRSDILRCLHSFDRRGHSLKTQTVADSDQHDPVRELGEIRATNLSYLLNNQLPPDIQKTLQEISRLAEEEKIKIYLVGGIIRDLLINYPPDKDLDFVVIGDAVDFTFKLQKLLGGSVRHFEQFGTASLEIPDSLRLDLVTARKEFYTSPAALPRVEKSSLKNDLFRRDFTINTMACSLEVNYYGEFHDYYNGKADLENGIIRALYQLSFVDDPLRILRAVRFEQRYGFKIEAKTLGLIQKAVEKKVLEKVSRQRLNTELKQIYQEPSPLKIMKRFSELQLLPFFYPRIKVGDQNWQLLSQLENILSWADSRDWGKKPDPELVYLSGLLFGLESADRSAIIRKLYLSRERGAIVHRACREAPVILNELDQPDLHPSAVVSNLESLPLEAILLVHALAEKKAVREHLKLYMDGLRYIRPRLKGGDLKQLGIKPGPLYREIINSLKQAVLDGEVRTPQEELDYVIRYLEVKKRKEE